MSDGIDVRSTDVRSTTEQADPAQVAVEEEAERDTDARFLEIVLADPEFLDEEFAAIVGGFDRPVATDGSSGRDAGSPDGWRGGVTPAHESRRDHRAPLARESALDGAGPAPRPPPVRSPIR
jgi:hypothetical protein